MFLQYEGKKTYSDILASIVDIETTPEPISAGKNYLLKGENSRILKYLVEKTNLKGTVDLIYIDPPYATGQSFLMEEGRASTISRSNNGKMAYSDQLTGTAFLEFLRERLFLLHELLSEQGSIYLHIDYKIGHYVKIIMDEIFGSDHFRNDITRIKCNPKNFARKGYGNIKDMILFYSKSDNPIWNEPKQPYSPEDAIKLFPKTEANGRRYTTIPLHAPGETQNGNTAQPFKGISPPKGRHWRTSVNVLEEWDEIGLVEWSDNGNPRKKIYFDEQDGKRVQDIWELKDPQYPIYPTEKNSELLERIINTSSHPDSIVLDAFCGSGTTIISAQKLGRKWIGIDASEEAINVCKKRLINERGKGDLFIAEANFSYCELT